MMNCHNRHDPAWWVGEFWCQPIKGESAMRCRIRWWLRAIFRLFRPALMSLFMWATWPNADAFVCNGCGAETPVEVWIL